ncbi:preprotein translocase subunit SecD [Ectothiorhodosinus mongolicus]|uniref:Protein translocase subunit SecD n=1 Tax=Ectothiorhodosinus mongolicus TaxID=233100 RepID=A0A1R3W5W4_9GAMM|nr:protein translocase subunit SecD [Ectothiorhodosinus mongolicus]ULX57649.1 protein translocase subunit SecD [Ectothiorhodosinus mongolicus]SIT73291.1 preprotein translocase subunit SecD [Ectothiorhodosinus mongolicus]
MNRYPAWKYLLIIAAVVFGLLYALPNLYPEDPVVQVAHPIAEVVDADTQLQIRGILEGRGVEAKAYEFDGAQFQVRFETTDEQLRAADILRTAMGDLSIGLNLAPATPGWLAAINARPMALGLDLRGGVHFLMEVDMDAVGDNIAERYASEFRTILREETTRYLTIERDGQTVLARFDDAQRRDEALNVVRREYRGDLDFATRQAGPVYLIVANISRDQMDIQRRLAVQQNITTLRNRVDELGVAEPVIQQQGENRIVVQLPGVQDTARAKEILGATATLEFRLVDEGNDPFEAQATGRVPANSRLYFERDGSPVLLQRRVMLTGDYINDATSGIAQDSGGPAVFINLDAQGARIFSRVTGENIGRLMGTVFIETATETVERDGEMVRQTTRTEEVINVARIQDQLGRRFQITGLDSTREARNLALLLRAGALAAPMSIIEERTVGPSLGRDNIERGFNSVVIGFILVLLFMAIYYRIFGVVANVALALNLVLIIAILSLLQATLTLPGIAGIVLTVGMAVDANVLIFERIREELRNGNSPQAAIQGGYANALSTIVDANITTLIAALVLFLFGTGPIKGFAITLSIGILVSMFTALVVTRGMINLIYGRRRRLQKLAI